jgi:HSP20 family molecular chaperone IbpA
MEMGEEERLLPSPKTKENLYKSLLQKGAPMILDRFQKNRMENERTVFPPVNIYQKGDSFHLSLEMPSVDKESLDISLEGEQLSVRGRKRRDDLDKKYTALLQEREPVEYVRTFQITYEIDREKISAAYEDGILTLTLPISPKVQPKKIEIKG